MLGNLSTIINIWWEFQAMSVLEAPVALFPWYALSPGISAGTVSLFEKL